MKDKKKQRDTKARVRAYKKRSQHIATIIKVAILVVIIAVSGYLIYSFLNQPSNQTFQFKAAIVDHLSITAPNQTFRQTATNTLKKAGYTVDYYPGEEVTVEFYRKLPTHGYSLIILRVHSSAVDEPKFIHLFTSEPHSKIKYLDEQLADRVGAVAFSEEDVERGEIYFGISQLFVQYSMEGTFNNATIIMMGCDGLRHDVMAEAFIQKEAKAYISWSGPVSASHTDQATTHLLECLITKKQTIKQAVTETMKEVGPDPADDSVLQFYPAEAEDYRLPNPTNELTMNIAETNKQVPSKNAFLPLRKHEAVQPKP